MLRISLLALPVLFVLPTAALAQYRDLNNEPTCSLEGSGMDPRCVGDTFAGTYSDMTAVMQRRPPQAFINPRLVGPRHYR